MIGLPDALAQLRAAAGLRGEGSVQALEDALKQVTSIGDSSSIGPLLLLLEDGAEYDEAMFSLIHAAEAFEDDTYVRAFLEVVPALQASAPRWASIVLMRILNNEPTKDALVRHLREMPEETKRAISWFCDEINKRSPAFLGKTVPVVLAAKTSHGR